MGQQYSLSMGGAVNKLIKDIKEDILNQESEIEAVQFEIDESIGGQGAAARATFTRLGLSNGTVNQLYGAYRAIDMDGGGSVSDMEFYTFFRLDQSKFTDRAFFLFDKDSTGEIDFNEFLAVHKLLAASRHAEPEVRNETHAVRHELA